MSNINFIVNGMKRAFSRFNARVERSGSRIKLYVPDVDNMSERQYYNLTSEIDAWCDTEGLYEIDSWNGDTWCWVFGVD